MPSDNRLTRYQLILEPYENPDRGCRHLVPIKPTTESKPGHIAVAAIREDSELCYDYIGEKLPLPVGAITTTPFALWQVEKYLKDLLRLQKRCGKCGQEKSRIMRGQEAILGITLVNSSKNGQWEFVPFEKPLTAH